MKRHTVFLDIDNAMTIPAPDTVDPVSLTSPDIELLGYISCTDLESTGKPEDEPRLRLHHFDGYYHLPR